MKKFHDGLLIGAKMYPMFFGTIGVLADQTFLFWAALAWFVKTYIKAKNA